MNEDKKIEEVALRAVQNYNKGSAFTDRKLTDTPTDALSVVNRKYVNMNGTTANRPRSSVAGQFYFDTSLGANGRPIWWSPTAGAFVDADGNVV